MTNRQKSLTWIVGLLIAYLAAAFPLGFFPFPAAKNKNVTLTTNNAASPPTCNAKPELPKRKYPQTITFKADNNGDYHVHFTGNSPFQGGLKDITVPKGGTAGPYTVKVTASTENDYYSLTRDGGCRQATQYIGVIVKP